MIIAITGGLGCGKSTVAGIFEEMGFKGLDCDRIAKGLLEKDNEVIESVRGRFGNAVFDKEGAIDRKAVAKIVFSDKEELKWLEGELHPKVLEIIGKEVKKDPEGKWAIEIPLLFEKKLEKDFEYTVCVSASTEVQLSRLAEKGVEKEEAEARIAQQMPLSAKEDRADFVILNNGPIDFLREQAALIVREIK